MSGGDTHLIHLIKKLQSNNHSVKVYIPNVGKTSLQSFGVKANFSIISSLSKRNGAIISFLWYTVKSLFSVLDIPEGSIAYSVSEFPPAVLAAFLAKKRSKRVKWVAAFHLAAPNPLKAGFLFEGGHIAPFIRGLLSFLSQKFSLLLMRLSGDLVFTADTSTADTIKKNRISPSRVKIIRIGVDRAPIGFRDKGEACLYDACFIGRFHPQKGVFDLLDIWEYVCQGKKDAKIAVVGDGDLRSKLQKTISIRGLSANIDLLGFRVGDAFYNIMKSSKILVFPSLHEGNPIVPLEAMACGLPVVAYELPVLREMYNNGGIIIVPFRDIKEFARKVLELLNNSHLYSKVSKESLKTTSYYDWNSQLEPAVKAIEAL